MTDLSSHLIAGITLACFKESGKIPAIRELLNDLDRVTEIWFNDFHWEII